MQLRSSLSAVLCVGAAFSPLLSAAQSSWGFTDATLSIKARGGGVQAPTKERFEESEPIQKELSLRPADVLKLQLTTVEGKEKARPHQASLLLKDAELGLDISYPLKVEESSKAKLELSQNELPLQFLQPNKTLDGHLLIASFGETRPLFAPIFQITVRIATAKPLPEPETITHRLPEIHHVFKRESKSPPAIICAFFVALVLATPPALFGLWFTLGANLKHLPMALRSAPLSHILFIGSVTGVEGVFYLYHTQWNLFQLLPVALAIGVLAVLSGSRALSEVQGRRLAGLR